MRKHPGQHVILVDKVVFQRGGGMTDNHDDQQRVEPAVNAGQQIAKFRVFLPSRSGMGNTPNSTVWNPLAELISQPDFS